MDSPEPLQKAKARIEVERAKLELWFDEQYRKVETLQQLDEVLEEYVYGLFFAFAFEYFNAALESDKPVSDVRRRIQAGLSAIINETFHQKHPGRHTLGANNAYRDFTSKLTERVRLTEGWERLQNAILELAEYQDWSPDDDAPVNLRMKSLRDEATWTQDDLADKAGVDVSVIKRAESGRTKMNAHSAESIAGAFSSRLGRTIKAADIQSPLKATKKPTKSH